MRGRWVYKGVGGVELMGEMVAMPNIERMSHVK